MIFLDSYRARVRREVRHELVAMLRAEAANHHDAPSAGVRRRVLNGAASRFDAQDHGHVAKLVRAARLDGAA